MCKTELVFWSEEYKTYIDSSKILIRGDLSEIIFNMKDTKSFFKKYPKINADDLKVTVKVSEINTKNKE